MQNNKELKSDLADCVVEYLNHQDEGTAESYFAAGVAKIIDKYSIRQSAVMDIVENLDIRCMTYGDSPDNFVYFTADTKGSDIAAMIADTFNGDYGDKTNARIDKFIENLEKHPERLEKDISLNDPVDGSTIEVFTTNPGSCDCELPWPDEEGMKEGQKP